MEIKGIRTKTEIPVLLRDMEKIADLMAKKYGKTFCISIESWGFSWQHKESVTFKVWDNENNYTIETWPGVVKFCENY